MQKLFISWLFVAVLFIGGCSTLEDLGEAIPDAMGNTPLMYKPDIQQGNVVTQEMVDKLQPGMTRRQVTYVLGTPLLVDTFHQNRWDYIYTKEKGGGAGNKQRVSLFFEDDVLIRIEGDLRPAPNEDPLAGGEETVFSVPDYSKKDKGFFEKTLNTMGVDTDDEESAPSAAGMSKDDQLPEMDKDNELPQTAEEAQVASDPSSEEEQVEDTEEEQDEETKEEKGFFSQAMDAIGL
jgi:outer membrane protein assembly factor BamE